MNYSIRDCWLMLAHEIDYIILLKGEGQLMGYRFTLETANIVANLSFGKVYECYRDICSSRTTYEDFLGFLRTFSQRFHSEDSEYYVQMLRDIRDLLYRDMFDMKISIEGESFFCIHEHTMEALKQLSLIFDRCKVKALLLPRMKQHGESNRDYMGNYDDGFIASYSTFTRIMEIHPGDSCLVLQPTERPENAMIFNAFPNFDVALRHAESWPAVLFWEDSERYAFVPVKNEEELLYLFRMVKRAKEPIMSLLEYEEQKKKSREEKGLCLFQLSDLHFGNRDADMCERRLKNLIRIQMKKTNDDLIHFVVTGDMINSPRVEYEETYASFAEDLFDLYRREITHVLGNHDVNAQGLAFFGGNQILATIVGNFPRIEIIEEYKTILLLFNSNVGGHWAEGEIGTTQMAQMGNLLDKVENIEDYTLVAVLHHHVLPVEKPAFYGRKWYEKIILERWMERTLRLRDAQLFLEWLLKRNVKVVLHGHKHIPSFAEHEGMIVIGCGSSTGQIEHIEKGKTYLSYNLIRICGKKVTCTQFAEEILGAGAANIRTEVRNL